MVGSRNTHLSREEDMMENLEQDEIEYEVVDEELFAEIQII